jgi:hypothetical protein
MSEYLSRTHPNDGHKIICFKINCMLAGTAFACGILRGKNEYKIFLPRKKTTQTTGN